MKNYIKVLALSGLLISTLNICFAQTAADSTAVKKTVKQKKSRIYTRVEIGFPAGTRPAGYDGSGPTVPTLGFGSSATVGYSISKNFRAGAGAGLLFNTSPYFPVFVSTEFGNHTKRFNASLNINAGYAFLIPNAWSLTDQTSGAFAEFLPTISFGSYKSKSRFRISLGNQFLVANRDYYVPIVFYEQYSANQRVNGFYPPGNTISANRIIRINMLLKVGMDF